MDWILLLLLLLLLLLALALLPLAANACRVLSVASTALPFLNGVYELSSWQAADGGGERYSHNGRPVFVSIDKVPRVLPVPHRGRRASRRSLAFRGTGGGQRRVGIRGELGDAAHAGAHGLRSGRLEGLYRGRGLARGRGLPGRVPSSPARRDGVIEAPKSPTLAGTYSLTDGMVDGRPLYAHARDGLYLYSRMGGRGPTWIVGEAPGDGSGLAFLPEQADEAGPAATAENEGPPHPPVGAGRGWLVALEGE